MREWPCGLLGRDGFGKAEESLADVLEIIGIHPG